MAHWLWRRRTLSADHPATARRPGAVLTDGVIKEQLEGGDQFGEARLRRLVEQTTLEQVSVSETVRLLSHTLMNARGGRTSDDASLLMVEWRGAPRDDEMARGILGGLPPATSTADSPVTFHHPPRVTLSAGTFPGELLLCTSSDGQRWLGGIDRRPGNGNTAAPAWWRPGGVP